MIQYSNSTIFKSIVTPLLFILTFFLNNTIQAQIFEDFETANKISFDAATLTLPTGPWLLGEARIGSGTNDQRNGERSVQMGHAGAKLQMEFDAIGAGDVTFFYGSNILDANNGRNSDIVFQYSIDSGDSWISLGDTLRTSITFQSITYGINFEQDVRFRILKLTGGEMGTPRIHRVNIDDFTITPFEPLASNPKIEFSIDNTDYTSQDSVFVSFPNRVIGSSAEVIVSFSNQGEPVLNADVIISQQESFVIVGSTTYALNSRESAEFVLRFQPAEAGMLEEALTIESNDPANPNIVIVLRGQGLPIGSPITIEEARSRPLGSTVKISGWITVANEFEGPVYLQDLSAGIAVFHNPLHTAVQIGDSVVVEGPLSEFGNTSGSTGDGLMQISGTGITYTVYPSGARVQIPRLISVKEMNDGNFEGQLVRFNNASITTLSTGNTFTGPFQASTNYGIVDYSDNGQIRIDNSTNLIGIESPGANTDVIGVVGRFRGTYQLFPRSTNDLQISETEIPGSNISKDLTLDVATWNIQWFGHPTNGPSNVEIQLNNVRNIIETLDFDLFALQEIADEPMFFRLVDSLANYSGFVANYSQTQRTAYLYKTATIDSVTSGYVAQTSTWAGGRFPFMFTFDATIDGQTQRIQSLNFHAKAFATQSDYNQRLNDSKALKTYTDTQVGAFNLLIIGDYNDDLTVSTYAGAVSPYQNFVDDLMYKPVTKSLSERGFTSYRSTSMIDHIIINKNMNEFHIDGSEQLDNPTYIASYLNTTSDHYPVYTRFLFNDLVSIDNPSANLPQSITLSQNYPNPFNPTTTIQFELPSADIISLVVYDVTGRLVSTLSNNQGYSSGSHQLTFDASALSSGLYFYHLQSASGVNITQKMMLIK